MLQIEAAMAGGSVSFPVEHVMVGICSSMFIPSTPPLSLQEKREALQVLPTGGLYIVTVVNL